MVESERPSLHTNPLLHIEPANDGMLLSSVRTHWGIENSVHWVLDVAFGEDASRVSRAMRLRTCLYRRMALNMLKAETTSQGGVAAKRKRAGWDEDYLLLVLAN